MAASSDPASPDASALTSALGAAYGFTAMSTLLRGCSAVPQIATPAGPGGQAASLLRKGRSMVVSCAPVMEVSRKVMHRAAELLDAGVSFALCTVVSARGSVPGKAGAKMIVLR